MSLIGRDTQADENGNLAEFLITDGGDNSSGSYFSAYTWSSATFTLGGNATADDYIVEVSQGFDLVQTYPGQYQITRSDSTYNPAQVFIIPIFDGVTEGDETVTMSLTSVNSDYGYAYVDWSYSSSSALIRDVVGTGLPAVSVEAVTPEGYESGRQPVTFILNRGGDLSAPLAVAFRVGGQATVWVDYDLLIDGRRANGWSSEQTFTFAAGQGAATVTIVPLEDSIRESTETVTLAVAADPNYRAGGVPSYRIGTPSTASGTIQDVPIAAVSVFAVDNSASETGLDPATFRFVRTGNLANPVTAYFSVGGVATLGADYRLTSGGLSLDAVYPGEVYRQQVGYDGQDGFGSGGPGNDAVDNSAGIGIYPSPYDYDSYLPVEYGSYYSVTFAAGQGAVNVTATPLTDPWVEGDESVVISVVADQIGGSYTSPPPNWYRDQVRNSSYEVGSPSTATATIADAVAPRVSVSVGDRFAGEVGPDRGTFILTRTGDLSKPLGAYVSLSGAATPGDDYTVNIDGRDVQRPPSYWDYWDYPQPYPSSLDVRFAPGQSTLVVAIDPIRDGLIEADESVTLTVTQYQSAQYLAGTPASATLYIADAPAAVVTVTASDATGSEVGADPITFRLNRTGELDTQTSVAFTLSGTAGPADYTVLVNGQPRSGSYLSAVFAPWDTTVTVTLSPVTDRWVEGAEQVTLSLNAWGQTGYRVGTPSSATATISDAQAPIVTVLAVDPYADEVGRDPAVFRFSRGHDLGKPLVVPFGLSGSAQFGSDYTVSGQGVVAPGWRYDASGDYYQPTWTVTIPAGQTTADLVATPLSDRKVEGSESVIVSLFAAPQPATYQPGGPATATIADAPPPEVTLVATDGSANEENLDPGRFKLSRTGDLTDAMQASVSVGGTATPGAGGDYELRVGGRAAALNWWYGGYTLQVEFAAGQSSVEVVVAPLADGLGRGRRVRHPRRPTRREPLRGRDAGRRPGHHHRRPRAGGERVGGRAGARGGFGGVAVHADAHRRPDPGADGVGVGGRHGVPGRGLPVANRRAGGAELVVVPGGVRRRAVECGSRGRAAGRRAGSRATSPSPSPSNPTRAATRSGRRATPRSPSPTPPRRW